MQGSRCSCKSMIQLVFHRMIEMFYLQPEFLIGNVNEQLTTQTRHDLDFSPERLKNCSDVLNNYFRCMLTSVPYLWGGMRAGGGERFASSANNKASGCVWVCLSFVSAVESRHTSVQSSKASCVYLNSTSLLRSDSQIGGSYSQILIKKVRL